MCVKSGCFFQGTFYSLALSITSLALWALLTLLNTLHILPHLIQSFLVKLFMSRLYAFIIIPFIQMFSKILSSLPRHSSKHRHASFFCCWYNYDMKHSFYRLHLTRVYISKHTYMERCVILPHLAEPATKITSSRCWTNSEKPPPASYTLFHCWPSPPRPPPPPPSLSPLLPPSPSPCPSSPPAYLAMILTETIIIILAAKLFIYHTAQQYSSYIAFMWFAV